MIELWAEIKYLFNGKKDEKLLDSIDDIESVINGLNKYGYDLVSVITNLYSNLLQYYFSKDINKRRVINYE